jgi:hypothetical protein
MSRKNEPPRNLKDSVKKIRPWLLTAALTLCAGCLNTPRALPGPAIIPIAPAPPVEPYTIEDHQGRETGDAIPEWVNRYLQGGIPLLEALAGYEERYLFVAHDQGTNLKALGQWVAGFRLAKDFSRLAAARVQARMTQAARGSPDGEYGRYFEQVIRASSDASYFGALREDDFWVYKQYQRESGGGTNPGMYEWYILISIDKVLLEHQITAILDQVTVDLPPTREQAAAILRLKENFYEEF